MTVRYMSIDGTLIENIDDYLLSQNGGDSRSRRLGFKRAYEHFYSDPGTEKQRFDREADPNLAGVCYILCLLFKIIPPVSILSWVADAMSKTLSGYEKPNAKDRRKLEDHLGLSAKQMQRSAAINDRDYEIGAMVHDRLGWGWGPDQASSAIAQILMDRSGTGEEPLSPSQIMKIYYRLKKDGYSFGIERYLTNDASKLVNNDEYTTITRKEPEQIYLKTKNN